MKICDGRRRWFAAACLILLTAFSPPRGGIGGTGRARGGVGGTGVAAIGVIQRFGSIYVNGREYLLRTATRYRVDGRAAPLGALHRGDTVFVTARVRAGVAVAVSVHVQHALIGVVTRVSDNGQRLRVLGQTVLVPRAVRARIRVGMRVAVSGFSLGRGRWRASRLHRLPTRARFLIRGRVEHVARHTLRLDGRRFRYAGPDRRAQVGAYVVARGRARGGHPVITSLRRALSLQTLPVPVAFVSGYLHRRAGHWYFQGVRLQDVRAAPRSQAAFFVVRHPAPGRFALTRIRTSISLMHYGLNGSLRAGPARPLLNSARHRRPTPPQRPAFARPPIMRPARPEFMRPEPPMH